MTKKTIILVIIFLIFINTGYWLYVTIKVSKHNEWIESVNRRGEILMHRIDKLPKEGEEGLSKYRVDEDKLSKEEKEEYKRTRKLQVSLRKEVERSATGFTNRMIRTFAESNLYTIPLLILAIIEVVLIAISFMIILLYKKE